MNDIIKNSYLDIRDKFKHILLIITPLILYYLIMIYLRRNNISSPLIISIMAYSTLIEFMVRSLTEISLYKMFLGFSNISPFKGIKNIITFCVFQLFLSLFTMLTLIITSKFYGKIFEPSYFQAIWIGLLNLLWGIYIVARLNIVSAMIFNDKELFIKKIFSLTKDGYFNWLKVSISIYLPYILCGYFISANIISMIIFTILSITIISFNCQYYRVKIADEVKDPE